MEWCKIHSSLFATVWAEYKCFQNWYHINLYGDKKQGIFSPELPQYRVISWVHSWQLCYIYGLCNSFEDVASHVRKMLLCPLLCSLTFQVPSPTCSFLPKNSKALPTGNSLCTHVQTVSPLFRIPFIIQAPCLQLRIELFQVLLPSCARYRLYRTPASSYETVFISTFDFSPNNLQPWLNLMTCSKRKKWKSNTISQFTEVYIFNEV